MSSAYPDADAAGGTEEVPAHIQWAERIKRFRESLSSDPMLSDSPASSSPTRKSMPVKKSEPLTDAAPPSRKTAVATEKKRSLWAKRLEELHRDSVQSEASVDSPDRGSIALAANDVLAATQGWLSGGNSQDALREADAAVRSPSLPGTSERIGVQESEGGSRSPPRTRPVSRAQSEYWDNRTSVISEPGDDALYDKRLTNQDFGRAGTDFSEIWDNRWTVSSAVTQLPDGFIPDRRSTTGRISDADQDYQMDLTPAKQDYQKDLRQSTDNPGFRGSDGAQSALSVHQGPDPDMLPETHLTRLTARLLDGLESGESNQQLVDVAANYAPRPSTAAHAIAYVQQLTMGVLKQMEARQTSPARRQTMSKCLEQLAVALLPASTEPQEAYPGEANERVRKLTQAPAPQRMSAQTDGGRQTRLLTAEPINDMTQEYEALDMGAAGRILSDVQKNEQIARHTMPAPPIAGSVQYQGQQRNSAPGTIRSLGPPSGSPSPEVSAAIVPGNAALAAAGGPVDPRRVTMPAPASQARVSSPGDPQRKTMPSSMHGQDFQSPGLYTALDDGMPAARHSEGTVIALADGRVVQAPALQDHDPRRQTAPAPATLADIQDPRRQTAPASAMALQDGRVSYPQIQDDGRVSVQSMRPSEGGAVIALADGRLMSVQDPSAGLVLQDGQVDPRRVTMPASMQGRSSGQVAYNPPRKTAPGAVSSYAQMAIAEPQGPQQQLQFQTQEALGRRATDPTSSTQRGIPASTMPRKTAPAAASAGDSRSAVTFDTAGTAMRFSQEALSQHDAVHGEPARSSVQSGTRQTMVSEWWDNRASMATTELGENLDLNQTLFGDPIHRDMRATIATPNDVAYQQAQAQNQLGRKTAPPDISLQAQAKAAGVHFGGNEVRTYHLESVDESYFQQQGQVVQGDLRRGTAPAAPSNQGSTASQQQRMTAPGNLGAYPGQPPRLSETGPSPGGSAVAHVPPGHSASLSAAAGAGDYVAVSEVTMENLVGGAEGFPEGILAVRSVQETVDDAARCAILQQRLDSANAENEALRRRLAAGSSQANTPDAGRSFLPGMTASSLSSGPQVRSTSQLERFLDELAKGLGQNASDIPKSTDAQVQAELDKCFADFVAGGTKNSTSPSLLKVIESLSGLRDSHGQIAAENAALWEALRAENNTLRSQLASAGLDLDQPSMAPLDGSEEGSRQSMHAQLYERILKLLSRLSTEMDRTGRSETRVAQLIQRNQAVVDQVLSSAPTVRAAPAVPTITVNGPSVTVSSPVVHSKVITSPVATPSVPPSAIPQQVLGASSRSVSPTRIQVPPAIGSPRGRTPPLNTTRSRIITAPPGPPRAASPVRSQPTAGPTPPPAALGGLRCIRTQGPPLIPGIHMQQAKASTPRLWSGTRPAVPPPNMYGSPVGARQVSGITSPMTPFSHLASFNPIPSSDVYYTECLSTPGAPLRRVESSPSVGLATSNPEPSSGAPPHQVVDRSTQADLVERQRQSSESVATLEGGAPGESYPKSVRGSLAPTERASVASGVGTEPRSSMVPTGADSSSTQTEMALALMDAAVARSSWTSAAPSCSDQQLSAVEQPVVEPVQPQQQRTKAQMSKSMPLTSYKTTITPPSRRTVAYGSAEPRARSADGIRMSTRLPQRLPTRMSGAIVRSGSLAR